MPPTSRDKGRAPGQADGNAFLAALGVAVVVISVATGMAAASQPRLKLPLFGLAAILLGFATIRWAANRFWIAIVIVFTLRPALDHFKSPDGEGLAQPAVVVGIVFLCSSFVWLYRRWCSGLPIVSSRSAIALLVLASVCVISAATSDAPIVSFQAAMRVVSSAVMLIVLEQALRDRPDRLPGLLVAAFASMAVPGLTAAFELAGNAPVVPEYGLALEVGRIRGTFVHPNAFAAYLTMLFPLAVAMFPHVRRTARVGVVCAAAASGFLLFFTYARGAWAATLVGLLFVGWLQDRRVIWLVLVGSVVLLMVVPSAVTRLGDVGRGGDAGPVVAAPDSLSWRIEYWQEILPFISEGPVTGIGLNAVERRTVYRLPPHNVFVQALIETGVAGLLALLAFFTSVAFDISRALRARLHGLHRGVVVGAAAVFAAFVVQCLSENLLSQPVVQWYLLVPLAWALSSNPAWPVPAPVRSARLPAR